MEKQLVSIIVPIYNTEKYLNKCVASLLNQSYKSIEIILVNDGSTDNSLDICLKYQKKDPRIAVINQSNQGLSSARNAGLKIFKGSYISFVDSDDYVDPYFIETNVNILEKYEAEIAVSCFNSVDEKTNKIHSEYFYKEKTYIKEYSSKKGLLQLAKGKIQSYVCNKVFKASLFDGLTFDVGKKYEDVYLMHLLFFKARKIIIINQPLYYYLQRTNSITHEYKQDNLEALFDALLKRHDFFVAIKMYKQCAYNLFIIKSMLRNLEVSQKQIDFIIIKKRIKQKEKSCNIISKLLILFLNINDLIRRCFLAVIRHLKVTDVNKKVF